MADLHQEISAQVQGYLEAQDLGDQLGRLPQVLRVVVELHAPKNLTRGDGSIYGRECEGCDLGSWPTDRPEWPCSTIQAIARELGIAPAAAASPPVDTPAAGR